MKSDNRASIPGFLRRWITKVHGSSEMAIIDEAGKEHDALLATRPHFWRSANATMLDHLRFFGVPLYLRVLIATGLFLYWRTPRFIRKWYWKIVPKNEPTPLT